MPFSESDFVRLGQYKVLEIVEGGQSAVCIAEETELNNRLVAVKAADPTDKEKVDRFKREAELLASLKHNNIISVYHLLSDKDTGEKYLILEYANGRSLKTYLDRHKPNPLSEQQAAKITLDICKALERTWAQGIVHFDMKPGNILLFVDDKDLDSILYAKLADFGIAFDDNTGGKTHYRGEQIVSSPFYASPEQESRKMPDVRADIYSLGITLFEMLTQKKYKRWAQGLSSLDEPPTLEQLQSQVSPSMAAIVYRATRPEPRDRYSTPQEMAADLQALLEGRPVMMPVAADLRPEVSVAPHAESSSSLDVEMTNEAPRLLEDAPTQATPLAGSPVQVGNSARRKWSRSTTAITAGVGMVLFSALLFGARGLFATQNGFATTTPTATTEQGADTALPVAVVQPSVEATNASSAEPAEQATAAPTAAPTETPTFTPSFTPTPSLTPEPGCTLAVESLYVRAGPGTEYPTAGVLLQSNSEKIKPQVRTADGAWVRLGPSGDNRWISGKSNYLTCIPDVMTLPVVQKSEIPPTPTPQPTSTPTSTPTNTPTTTRPTNTPTPPIRTVIRHPGSCEFGSFEPDLFTAVTIYDHQQDSYYFSLLSGITLASGEELNSATFGAILDKYKAQLEPLGYVGWELAGRYRIRVFVTSRDVLFDEDQTLLCGMARIDVPTRG